MPNPPPILSLGKDSPINSDITGSPEFRTFMSPLIRSHEDNDSANLSNKIARLKEDEYAKVINIIY